MTEKQEAETLLELGQKWSSLSSNKSSQDADYDKYQRFYDGDQWWSVRWDSTRKTVTDNMCAPIVNTFASLIMGEMPVITSAVEDNVVSDVNDTPIEYRRVYNRAEAITKIISEFTAKSNADRELYECAMNASLFGRGVIFVDWKDGQPVWQNVFPGYYRAGYKADDMREILYSFYTIPMTWFQIKEMYPDYELTDKEFEAIKDEEGATANGESGTPSEVNKIPKIAVKRYYGPLGNDGKMYYVVQIGHRIVKREEMKGPKQRFVEFKNIPVPNSELGVSDLENVIPLQEELNVAMSQWTSIIEAESATKVIVPGGNKETMIGLKKAGPAVVATPNKSDQQPFLLQWGNRAFALKDRIVSLKREIYEVSGLSEVFLARPDISIVSGVGLTTLITPTLQRMKPRIINWSAGIKQLVDISLTLLEDFGGKEPKSKKKYKEIIEGWHEVDVKFSDRMPRDEGIHIQNEMMKLQTKVQSRMTTMVNLGVRRPLDEMDQIAFEEYNPMYNREGAMEMAQMEAGQRQGPPLDQVISEANRENKRMEQGSQDEVTEELPEEHQAHIETHANYVEERQASKPLPPEIMAIFDAHIAQHEKKTRYTGGNPGQGVGGGRPPSQEIPGMVGEAGAMEAPQVSQKQPAPTNVMIP